MAPNKNETDVGNEFEIDPPPTKAAPVKYQLLYMRILVFTYYHLSAFYGLYLCWTSAKWSTIVFNFFLHVMSMLGTTAGAHRLWSHKSFKAKIPLQIMLIIFQSMASRTPIILWVAEHKLHHSYTDTDADPHNSSRGFFYSHMGWIFVKPHPEVTKRMKKLDLTELYNNPLLRFQKKYSLQINLLISLVIPTFIPSLWGEPLWYAWHLAMFRTVVNMQVTYLINSVAHLYGYRPYEKNINAVQNIPTAIATLGEGFHNYHHTFPWDYRAAELGNNRYNLTTLFIDLMAKIGWAYDLKTVPDHIIEKRMKRTGDGTNLWGKDEDINGIERTVEDLQEELYYTHDFAN